VKRWITYTLVVLSLSYLLVCITPLRIAAIRFMPDFARFFFLPFFYYTKSFHEGSVGPIYIGQSVQEVEAALRTSYPEVTRDPSCHIYRNPSEVTATRETACYHTSSRYSRHPLLWLIGLERDRVQYIRVTTQVPVDF